MGSTSPLTKGNEEERERDEFPKKNIWIGGWVGGLSSIQFFLDFWNFVNFAKPLSSAFRRCMR